MYKFIFFIFLALSIFSNESITGKNLEYRKICEKAATDVYYFNNFRALKEYRKALEIHKGHSFAHYIINSCSDLLIKLEDFRKLDFLGNPPLLEYDTIGKFSGTTLRYIAIAGHIKKLFNLPQNAKIAEIGAGFGGQCYILSCIQSFSKYYIYDLPEVELLINKVLKTLKVKNTFCIPQENNIQDKEIDLFLSNYAFSECDCEIQLDYIKKVISKSKRGYVIYNQIGVLYGFDNILSPLEFVEMVISFWLPK